MPCPYLEYRSADEDQEFDHDRPYCGIQETFVSPMQADICNDRFDLHHADDCAVYREYGRPEAVTSLYETDGDDVVPESSDPAVD